MVKLIVLKIESKPKTNTTRAYKKSEIKLIKVCLKHKVVEK